MRSGSSVKDTSGASGVRSTPAARSATPPNGSISSGASPGGAGDPQRHGVDGEVAAGQVGLDVVGEGHVGLAGVGA